MWKAAFLPGTVTLSLHCKTVTSQEGAGGKRCETSLSSLYHVQEAKLHPPKMKFTLHLIYLSISKQLMRSYLKHHPRLWYLSRSAGRKAPNQLPKTQQTCRPYSVPVEAVTKTQQIFPLLMPAVSSAAPVQPGEGELDSIHL